MNVRRQFALPPEDEEFLDEYGCRWETIVDGSQWLLLHDFDTRSAGYNHRKVTAAIRIETGYPKARLDMVYFHPALARNDNKPIGASQVAQALDGKSFQRWSRHYTKANPWRPGEDGIDRHVVSIEEWLIREFEK